MRWSYGPHSQNSIVVSVDSNIKLHVVRLFGGENNEYSVIVKVSDAYGVTLATKTGTFSSKLVQSEGGEYHSIDIVFQPPLALKKRIKYCLEASIRGPPSLCGQDGSSRVQRDRVNFSFANKAGAVEIQDTTVSYGQFSEFLFAIN